MTLVHADILEENIRLHNEVADLKLEVKELLAKLRFIAGLRFATSQSEKMSPLQGSLFNEAEALAAIDQASDETVKVDGHTRKRHKRTPLPEHLPRSVFKHDLSGAEKRCPHGRGPMDQTGTTVTEQFEYQPAVFQVLRHECATYGCIVCCEKKIAAISHPQPLPGTMATASLLAYIAAAKYVDHLPLYRQEKILARQGILISRTTLATWMIKIAERLRPLVVLMQEEIVTGDIVQMDETRLQVLSLPDKSPKSLSYMWVMVGGVLTRRTVVFELGPSREGVVAERMLKDFSGYLQADGYDGYNAVCRRQDIQRIGCLMHIRRPFKAAHQQLKGVGGGQTSTQVLAYIQALYKVEEEAASDPKTGRLAMTPEQRFVLRQEKSAPILDALHAFVVKHASLVRPSSPTGEALTYCINEWPYFIGFMKDGRLEIDNGRAERAIRPFAQGRRNWLFADTEAGAHASATLYSLVETAKLYEIEPKRYLQYVFERIDRAATVEQLEALLPWNIPKAAS